MADLIESRCRSEALIRTDHLLRVACIGDSMVWGQGVSARNTLPAHLGRILNAGLPQEFVWVDNFGESSGNLWHAWTRMQARASAGDFAAIVFSVCQNDSQIFESNLVEYELDKAQYWSADSVHFKHACRVFEDFAGFCAARRILGLVIFYTFFEEDRPIVAALERQTDRLGLPFIDLLSYLRDEVGLSVAEYIASEFDGHPSSWAHELAARRVAKELIGLLAERSCRNIASDLGKQLPVVMTELADGEVPPEVALAWAREALSEKARTLARERSRTRASIELCRGLLARIAECEATWRGLRRIEANLVETSALLECREVALPNLFLMVRNLEEAVFLIANSGELAELAELGDLFVKGHYYGQTRQLNFFTGDARREIAEARARLGRLRLRRLAIQAAGAADLFGPNRPWRTEFDFSAIAPELRIIDHLAQRIGDQLDALEAMPGPLIEPSEARPIWAMTLHLARAALYYLEAIDERLVGTVTDAEAGPPWTFIEATLEGGPHPDIPDGICRLVAEIDYIVPRRMRVREMAWAGVAKERSVYRFELPLLIRGDLRIGVLENEPTRQRFVDGANRISRVRIYNEPPPSLAGNAPASVPVLEWCDSENRQPLLSFVGLVLA